jgi:hypothetical protein
MNRSCFTPRVALRKLLSGFALAASLTGCSDVGTDVVTAPQPVLSDVSFDFGTALVGQAAVRTLTLRNGGSGTLTGTVSLSCPGYEIVSGGGTFSLSPDESWTVILRFSPAAEGSFPCTLDLGPDVPPVPLLGIGALAVAGAACELAPGAIDLGVVPVGGMSAAYFVIRSVGTAPLAVNVVANAPGVTVVAGGGPDILEPGESKTVAISFDPTVGGRMSGVVVIGPGCPDVTVTGVGTTISFAGEVAPILYAKCAACHYWDFVYDLPSLSHASLVGFPSWGYPAQVRVEPFDPSASVLYGKITNSGQFGAAMPPSGALLTTAETDLIRDWILEGAANN